KRAAGIWYAASADRGRTWSAALRIDNDPNTDIWPWIAAGSPGRVAIAWFGADKSLPLSDTEASGAYAWRVKVAHTVTGLGCGKGTAPAFRVVDATADAMHVDVVCEEGTACPALGLDRRLGDFFTTTIDTDGRLIVAYSDTRKTGPVALAAVLRQDGGSS